MGSKKHTQLPVYEKNEYFSDRHRIQHKLLIRIDQNALVRDLNRFAGERKFARYARHQR